MGNIQWLTFPSGDKRRCNFNASGLRFSAGRSVSTASTAAARGPLSGAPTPRMAADPWPAMARLIVILVAGLALSASAADGLRCYVCNSKADSRCSDPIRAAEETNNNNNDRDNWNNNNNNNNNNKNGNNYYYNYNNNANKNSNSNNNNNRIPGSYNNRHDERNEGLQMVDCKVAHNVRQAMDAVSGLLSRLGQRAPGGGDVWGAVRGAMRGAAHQWPGGQGPQGGQGGGSGGGVSRPQEEQDSTAACHKVDMEVDGELVTDRGCAPGRILGQEPCEALAATLGDTEFCELCDGDGCNAAPSSLRASDSLAAAGVLLLALRHHGLGHGLGHGLEWRR